MKTRVEMAHASWGGRAPEYVVAIAEEWDRLKSARQVGDLIGYSAAAVSQLVANKYPGSAEKVAYAVRHNIDNGRVSCPELREITMAECRDWQSREFSSASPLMRAMFRACRVCERNPNREGAS